jgi:uncharacterized protein (TIGR03382 family)
MNKGIGHMVLPLACVAGAQLALPPPQAWACSCNTSGIAEASIEEGAQEVPVDVAPFIVGNFDDASITWLSEAGGAVAFTLGLHRTPGACPARLGELVPDAPLEPDTSYVIRAQSAVDPALPGDEVRFRTGRAAVPLAELRRPDVTATFVVGEGDQGDCWGPVKGCLFIEQDGVFEVIELGLRGEQMSRSFVRGGVDISLGVPAVTAPHCLEVRARDAAGRTSEPATLCGDDLPVRAPRPEDLGCAHGEVAQAVFFDGGPPMVNGELGPVGTLDAGAPTVHRGEAGQRDANPTRGAPNGGAAAGCSASGPAPPSAVLAIGLAVALALRRRGPSR